MKETVILAAGEFPKKGSEGERLLKAAKRVVACDSAAKSYFRAFHHWPDVVVGDLDSIGRSVPCCIVRDMDQDTNDLTKAIRFCRAEGWNNLVIVGATGCRDDHTIGNIYRALEDGIQLVTDYGSFYPVSNEFTFHAPCETGVSVFAPDPKTKMESFGLRWPLDGVKFKNPWCATLNRVNSDVPVTIFTNRPCFVFVERRFDWKRVILSLGSNLNTGKHTREEYLEMARLELEMISCRVDESEVIETEGVGVPTEYKDYKFLNQILLVETDLTPNKLLNEIHRIEKLLGRVRTIKNGPRTIDIDIIDYEGVKMRTKSLVLPHPRAKKRAFVMEPIKSLGLELK